jgi:hypothetical protein
LDILAYVQRVRAIEDQWWELALKRVESRANFQRYIGKRKVLDAFFSQIKKQIARTFPEADVTIAYGSSGPTMKPTGKGECAVPTTGTYIACKRIFSDRTQLVDEYGSTSRTWTTGLPNEAVYRVPGTTRREDRLGSMPNKAPPPRVPEPQKNQVLRYAYESQWKQYKSYKFDPNAILRFPMVRGLRFCPESRMYFNRDLKSAQTIGRLYVMERLGQGRPTPFHRSSKPIAA